MTGPSGNMSQWSPRRPDTFLTTGQLELLPKLSPQLAEHICCCVRVGNVAKQRVKHPSPNPPPIHDCDAVGGAFDFLGANATTSWRLAIYIEVLTPLPIPRQRSQTLRRISLKGVQHPSQSLWLCRVPGSVESLTLAWSKAWRHTCSDLKKSLQDVITN